MSPIGTSESIPSVCAVSYLNTSPLVWGLEQTDLGRRVRLEYALPSECADRVREGCADLGILPVIEIERQGLDWLPDTGIACDGPVRTILIVSKVPLDRVRTLAADTGSRTSVMLSRIILAGRYGSEPETIPMLADLDRMLASADAALIIGDPALLLDPDALRPRYEVLDLGEEWRIMTGLPMIFALWAGRKRNLTPAIAELFSQSCDYGLRHIDDIVNQECPKRGVPEALGREYLTRHIVFRPASRHYEGMRRYLLHARELKEFSGSRTVHA